MVDQEVGELPYHIHNVGRDERFGVLGLALFAEVEELLDHSTQELILSFNIHAA